MRIAVTGARGLVGTALCQVLGQLGHEITVITRHPREQTDLAWNPEAGQLAADRLEGVDAVVHLAGENIAARRWNERVKQRIRNSRVLGTQLLSSTVARLSRPPAAMICASAVGYYGDRGEQVLEETAAPGDGFLSQVCREWESAVEPARQAGIRVVHMRIGVVLAKQGGALAKMLLPFRLGLGGVIGSGKQYWSWVELYELAQMFAFALTHADLSGPINAVSPQPVTNREFTKALGRVLHRPTILPMPAWLARVALGEMADELLLASTRAVPTRLQQAGYPFMHTELEAALRAVLQR